jgi:O-6-methylguanine DNA methyltransferase
MTDNDQTRFGAARRLARDLHALGPTVPPETLRPAVMIRVGLADHYWLVATAIGPMFVAANGEGISSIRQAGDAAVFERAFRERFGRTAFPVSEPPADLARAVERALAGDRRARPRLDLRRLSPFEREVLGKATEIPRGEVRPYGWIAREIGRPAAVRAVGSALGRNPIPLLIPCHRVVRESGEPGQYLFGSEAKRTLLGAEGVPLATLENGARLVGSDTTRIVCYPTCRNARRIAEAHRVPFETIGAATAAGYRPCEVCRPAA